jgi:hypothetical protein
MNIEWFNRSRLPLEFLVKLEFALALYVKSGQGREGFLPFRSCSFTLPSAPILEGDPKKQQLRLHSACSGYETAESLVIQVTESAKTRRKSASRLEYFL